MLTMNDLRKGVAIIYEDQPYEVMETHHLRMQQRRPVMQTRMKNLLTGTAIERNFQQADSFKEAAIEKKKVMFLYSHRADFVFQDSDNPKERFTLPDSIIGDMKKWLKPNTPIEAVLFNGKIITISIPIKMELAVKDAPPGVKGDTAQGGTKAVTLETGAVIQAPLFINQGDILSINTESGLYVERVKKA